MRVFLRLLLPAAVLLTLLAPIGAGAAVPAPSIAFTPSSWTVGPIAPGTSVTQTFLLKNSGGSASSALTLTIGGPGAAAFKIGPDGCTATSLGPGKSCSVTVTYAPTRAGTHTATLTAASKRPVASASANLNGLADQAPVAHDDSYTTHMNAPLTVNSPGVLANDTVLDAGDLPLTASPVSGPSHGTLTFHGNGSFTYTSIPDWFGTDSFTYRATDSFGLTSNTATVTITVTDIAPIALSEVYNLSANTTLTDHVPGVLNNTSDPDGDPVHVSQVNGQPGNVNTPLTLPSGALLTVNADGSFHYDPNHAFDSLPAGAQGQDSFTFTASDGALESNTATVTLFIVGVNDPPVANNDTYTTNEGQPLTINAPGLLGNDSDPEGDPFFVAFVNGHENGITGGTFPTVSGGDVVMQGVDLASSGNGSFTYIPAPHFHGTDTFTYQAEDTQGALSNLATATITVRDNPPDCIGAGVSTPVNTPIVWQQASDLLNAATCTDPDGDQITIESIQKQPDHGTLTLGQTGQPYLTYTPPTDYNGSDAFVLRVSDGNGAHATLAVSISVGSG